MVKLARLTGKRIRLMTYQDDDPETTSREQQVHPILNLVDLDVVTGRDDPGFVQSAIQLNDDFSGPMVIDNLKLSNITWRTNSSICERML